MSSKKIKRKKNPAPKNIPSILNVTKKKEKNVRSSYHTKRFWPVVIIFALSFIIYGRSLNFGYILDDQMVVSQNRYVQKGLDGFADIFGHDSFMGYFDNKNDLYLLQGGRYRPLSLATFAAEISVFGSGKPSISHFINILLYAITGLMLFHIFLKLGEGLKKKENLYLFSLLAAIIWILHPLHTECVTNIKGRDEILALIGSLAALWSSMKYEESNKTSWLILSGILLFIALLAKENALTFVGIIPLTIWFFRKSSISSLIKTGIPLFLAAGLFILLRYEAVGYFMNHGKAITNLMNDSFLEMSQGEKYATIFYTLGWYIKLLFIPYPLTHDYYPYHVPKMNWSDISVYLSLFIYIFMSAWAIYKIRNRNFYSYTVLFFLMSLSIVSNLVFSVGTFMNERFLYTPSVAFALAISYFLVYSLPQFIPRPDFYKKSLAAIAIIMTSAYLWIGITRVSDWRDPLSLDRSAIHVSGNSARANCYFAVSLYTIEYPGIKDPIVKEKIVDSMEYYINRSLAIYPDYEQALHMKTVILTARYEIDHKIDTLLTGFEEILKKIPDYGPALDNITSYIKYLFSVDANRAANFCYKVGYQLYYKKRKDLSNALRFLQICIDMNFRDQEILYATAEVYEANGDKKKAEEIRKSIDGQK
ncbi:MAG TPA: hypothetical protein VKC90_08505 [Chitinophagaceae bacterium]|nr:hypothetical protein [Chitinophagaceae bacterium]